MINPGSLRRFSVEYDARLVEGVVLLCLYGHPEEHRFRRGRDRIYDLADSEEREKRFREFHAHWFQHLRLGRPIMEALEEQPSLIQQTRRCCVLPAPSKIEEGADLHELRDPKPEGSEAERVILISLQPTRLLDSSSLQPWLRHELMHIADMLDPHFGYEPLLPSCEAGPGYANLLRERYRVLWDTWIDGRLLRRGWLAEEVREKRWVEFTATFSMLDREAQEKFQEIFDSDSQTHAGLMTFALNPRTKINPARGGKSRAQPCPLCRFPTFHLLDDATGLPEEVRDEIVADFAGWQPEDGLCCQCADLYRARNLSRSAEATLPRI